jgi:hypothetical protein
VAEILAALGPRISAVEDAFAKRYGWTPDKSTRVWERNPAYKAHDFSLVQVGKPPQPWAPQKREFDPELMRKHGGRVNAIDLEVQRRLTDPRVKAALNVKPHINRSYDIPYVAGDQRRSAHLYQDRHFFSDKDLDELLWLRLCRSSEDLDRKRPAPRGLLGD